MNKARSKHLDLVTILTHKLEASDCQEIHKILNKDHEIYPQCLCINYS